MFAKSETLPIFVLPNSRANTTSEYIRSLYNLGVSLTASISCGCDCLATLEGTSSFYIYIIELLTSKMPNSVKSAQAVKYSNGGTLDTVVYATSRAEAIGKAIITASAIHPNYDIRPLSFGGYRICEQLD